MARKRKEASADNIKLRQPDRSGPSEQTLLEMAQQQDLFRKAKQREAQIRNKNNGAAQSEEEEEEADDDQEGPGLSPTADRIMDAILWTVSLSMLHFTLDVLVQNQYAVEISWSTVSTRAVQAFFGESLCPVQPASNRMGLLLTHSHAVFFLLFYTLHPHSSNPILLPGLPARYQNPLRQAIFFVASVSAGCYLIHISNRYSYLAVMKQAPPLGCIWVWSVIELDLPSAVLSLACAGLFLWQGGYDFK